MAFLLNYLFLFCLLRLLTSCHGLPQMIRIGGLFDTEDEEQEHAFRIAVDWINTSPSLLNQSRIIAQVERLAYDDSYRASKQFCNLLQAGIAAAFGPQSDLTSMHVQSICDALEVPHILARWEYRLQRDDLSVNLYPHPTTLSKAFIQLVEVWGWKEFYFVYQENEGTIRLQDFLKESEIRGWQIRAFQLGNDVQSYRSTFWEIQRFNMPSSDKESKMQQRIVLDVPREVLPLVLKSAQQVGMITERQGYIITSLDVHATDMRDFQYSKTNITALRLVQEDSIDFKRVLAEINKRVNRARNRVSRTTLRTDSALTFDMVMLFAAALEAMDRSKDVAIFPPISCTRMNKGSDGTSLINYMKNTQLKGLTGQVNFDAEGFRSRLLLDIMYLTETGLEKIGTMMPGDSINITRTLGEKREFAELENKCYIVSTILSQGFIMYKDSSEKLSGNDRYEGYVIDLVESLSQRLHFTYKIREVNDSKYGEDIGNGVWNGMIGEIMSGVADFAAADLTINLKRESVVDFTMPFMNTGISILFKKPTTKVTSLFSFLSPFSIEVWIFVIVGYITVSVVLFIVGRLCPYEWSNPHPCRQEDTIEENPYSLLDSMWFTIGSLLQQGSDLAPSSSSTRTIASMWYFFNLIMISSYTANLAAFLTVENIVYPFESAKDLAKQERIKYGVLAGGSTEAFFKTSTIEMYQKMYTFMIKHKDEVFFNNKAAAEDRVLQGNYAFFAEESSIEYLVERQCNFTQIGGLLDNKGYGIAVKKENHKLSMWLTGGILKLQEEGLLHTFKERWWKQKKGGGKCSEASAAKSSVTELGLGNVGGVFVVMVLGFCISSIVVVLEFIWYSRKVDKPQKEPLLQMLLKEVKFAASCGSSEKPAPKLRKEKKPKSMEAHS